MKRLFILCLLLGALTHPLHSQSTTDNTPAVVFTTEGLWNATSGVANWVNLLGVDYEFTLWRGATLSLDLLAVANLRAEQGKSGVADHLHIFSAIEDSPSTLALMAFGVGQELLDGRLMVWGGVRNLSKDYFTTPWNSIFTAGANGLFPTIANNFVVADPPAAALSLHTEWQPIRGLIIKASLYDGVASDKWNDIFRLNLRKDGLFTIGEVSYHGNDGSYVGNYHLGATFGFAPLASTLDEGSHHKSRRASMWALVEQPLYIWEGGSELELIAQGGWAPAGDCDLYGEVGVVCSSLFVVDDYIGCQMSRTLCAMGNETHIEFTYSLPWSLGTLQPALHRVWTSHNSTTLGVVKVIIEM